jgi:hypothetical protein
MAAGLGFKDFVTGEVLTAADVDGYLMQGVWVFASAAARDAAVTSPQEGNFAYLKDTNVTTYYTGSAWANLDTTGMTNPMTTTGDTIYSSSGSTPARLGIGTAGQVLRVNSGATAPEWAAPAAGALTFIKSETIGSGVSSVTVSSAFSATYENYLVTIQINSASDSTSNSIQLGSTATGYYGNATIMGPGATTVTGAAYSNATNIFSGYANLTNGGTSILNILQPNLAKRTSVLAEGISFSTTGSTNMVSKLFEDSNTQHTAFTLTPNTGTFTGGTIRVYGYANS